MTANNPTDNRRIDTDNDGSQVDGDLHDAPPTGAIETPEGAELPEVIAAADTKYGFLLYEPEGGHAAWIAVEESVEVLP